MNEDGYFLIGTDFAEDYNMFMEDWGDGNIRSKKGDVGPQCHIRMQYKGTDEDHGDYYTFTTEKWPNWYVYM